MLKEGLSSKPVMKENNNKISFEFLQTLTANDMTQTRGFRSRQEVKIKGDQHFMNYWLIHEKTIIMTTT